MYEYRCKVVKIIDGDTVDVDIDLGFGVWLKKERIRMYGIDTPESTNKRLGRKEVWTCCKEIHYRVCWMMRVVLFLRTRKDAEGKFGRILGELWRTTDFADKSINDYMIDKRHAVAYHGQSKEDIQEQHIKNRDFH